MAEPAQQEPAEIGSFSSPQASKQEHRRAEHPFLQQGVHSCCSVQLSPYNSAFQNQDLDLLLPI